MPYPVVRFRVGMSRRAAGSQQAARTWGGAATWWIATGRGSVCWARTVDETSGTRRSSAALLDRSAATQEPDARIIVFSREPGPHPAAHPDVEAVPWEGVSRTDSGPVLAELDLLILGGGGILYDREARRYLRVVRVAQERGLPLITYAVGVGPLSDGGGLRHGPGDARQRDRR